MKEENAITETNARNSFAHPNLWTEQHNDKFLKT